MKQLLTLATAALLTLGSAAGTGLEVAAERRTGTRASSLDECG